LSNTSHILNYEYENRKPKSVWWDKSENEREKKFNCTVLLNKYHFAMFSFELKKNLKFFEFLNLKFLLILKSFEF